jgi:hypothetical protein
MPLLDNLAFNLTTNDKLYYEVLLCEITLFRSTHELTMLALKSTI